MNQHKQTILEALRKQHVNIEMMDLEHSHRERELAPVRAAIAAVEAWESAPAAQPQPTRGQPHVNVPWHPVDAILWDGKSLYADDLAVTIGEGDTALATFVWPSEGDYAVCKRMQPPDYNMGATYTRDGDVVTVDMQPPD